MQRRYLNRILDKCFMCDNRCINFGQPIEDHPTPYAITPADISSSSNFDEMNDIVDLPSGLSSDFEKLYESGKYTDVSIIVGKEPNSKIFLAHTLVLCTRSTFLENSLTKDTETCETAAVTFKDMAPDVFEVLLR